MAYSTDYAYIERAYGLHFESGQRVWHEETKRFGTVKRCNRSSAHYVNVLFDGAKRNGLCHPASLEITAASQPIRTATAQAAPVFGQGDKQP